MIYSTEGDIGDAVYSLSIAHDLKPWPHTLLLQPSQVTAQGKNIPLFHRLFSPLAESQGYIKECRPLQEGDQIQWHSGGFRGAGLHHPGIRNLGAHVAWLIQECGIGHHCHGERRWLTVPPDPRGSCRVVISRTSRYQNRYFPWDRVVQTYKDRILFLGTPLEHTIFSQAYGQVEYLATENLLEAAKVIEASLLFIGNQSSLNAVAEGLKHHLIQETCLHLPDCIWIRPNAQHVWDGVCILPGFDGAPDVRIDPSRSVINTDQGAPGGWQWPRPEPIPPNQTPWLIRAWNFDHCVKQCLMHAPECKGKTYQQVSEMVMEHTRVRLPHLGANASEFEIVLRMLPEGTLAPRAPIITPAAPAPRQAPATLVPHA